LQANKWMPHRTSIELSGATDNPQEWLDELVREAVDGLPFVIEQVGLERIKNWFGEDSERFIALSQKLMQEQAQAGQAGQTPPNALGPQGGTQQPNAAPSAGEGGGSAQSAMPAAGRNLQHSVAPRGGSRTTGRMGNQAPDQRAQQRSLS